MNVNLRGAFLTMGAVLPFGAVSFSPLIVFDDAVIDDAMIAKRTAV